MFISTAVAGLIAVLLAGPPVGGPDPAPPGRPLLAGNAAPAGSPASSTNLPKPSRTVKVGADGVPQEIVVVPFPIDGSGVPSGPIAIPDFGMPDLQVLKGPVRRKSGSATAPQWRDRNWDSAWEGQRPKQRGQAKRHDRTKQHKSAKKNKRIKQNKRAKKHNRPKDGRPKRHDRRPGKSHRRK